MAVSLNNPNMTPPGLFRYRVPETGHMLKEFYAWNDLEDAVVKHYKANRLAVPSDLRQLILDQLCQQLPPGWCKDGTNSFVGFVRGLMHEFQRVLMGTTAMADWILTGGGQPVDDAEVIRRGLRCQKCVFNQPPIGCSSCSIAALNKIIERFLAGRSLPIDNHLESCMICGCSLKVKLRSPIDVLRRHITSEQMLQFPPASNGWDGCWIREDLTKEQHA